jgi:hypothetical protein
MGVDTMKVEAVTTPGYLKCDAHRTPVACEGEVRSYEILVRRLPDVESTDSPPPAVLKKDKELCEGAVKAVIAAIESKLKPVTRTRKGRGPTPEEQEAEQLIEEAAP